MEENKEQNKNKLSLTVEVDSNDLQALEKSFSKMFDSMTIEQKSKIYEQLLNKFLFEKETMIYEDYNWEDKLLEQLKKDYPHDRDLFDHWNPKNSRRFQEVKNNLKHTKKIILLENKKLIEEYCKDRIKEKLEKDEEINKFINDSVEYIKKNFDKVILGSLIHQVANQISYINMSQSEIENIVMYKIAELKNNNQL